MSPFIFKFANYPTIAIMLIVALPAATIPKTSGQQATALKARHQPNKAADNLVSYLAAHPDDIPALTALARIRLDQLDTTEAIKLLNHALGLSPNSPGTNNALGEIQLQQHQYPKAMDRFETVLATNLRDVEARKGELAASTGLALDARAAGRPEAALECLRHARESLPDDATLLTDLGIQSQQMHLLPQAAEALNAALTLSPQRLDTLYALARVETDQDHLPEAEQHLRVYLAARPGDPSAHFGLGHVLEKQLRTEAATAEFQRSIELQPVQTESYYQLGQISLDNHDDANARLLYEKTLLRAPRHGGALTGLGIVAYRAKDWTAARKELSAAVHSSPDYQPAHYYLGLTLARMGDKIEADRELSIAVELAHKQQGKGGPQPSSEGP